MRTWECCLSTWRSRICMCSTSWIPLPCRGRGHWEGHPTCNKGCHEQGQSLIPKVWWGNNEQWILWQSTMDLCHRIQLCKIGVGCPFACTWACDGRKIIRSFDQRANKHNGDQWLSKGGHHMSIFHLLWFWWSEHTLGLLESGDSPTTREIRSSHGGCAFLCTPHQFSSAIHVKATDTSKDWGFI